MSTTVFRKETQLPEPAPETSIAFPFRHMNSPSAPQHAANSLGSVFFLRMAFVAVVRLSKFKWMSKRAISENRLDCLLFALPWPGRINMSRQPLSAISTKPLLCSIPDLILQTRLPSRRELHWQGSVSLRENHPGDFSRLTQSEPAVPTLTCGSGQNGPPAHCGGFSIPIRATQTSTTGTLSQQ